MKEVIFSQNPWWNDASARAPLSNYTPRIISEKFEKFFATNTMISLSGLRQIGKTTLIKRKINQLLENGVSSRKILYISFEKTQEVNKEALRKIILEFLSNITKQEVYKAKETYIFLDEIQLIDGWQDTLKYFYDMNQNLKFVISGSSSLYIKKANTESLLGRIIDLKMDPLTFGEFLLHKKSELKINFDFESFLLTPQEEKFKDLKIYSHKLSLLQKEYNEYLHFGYFPKTIEFPDINSRNLYIQTSIFNKTIEIDIPELFGIQKRAELKKLFDVLVAETGSELQITNLSKDISIDKSTLYSYLDALEESMLVYKIPKYTKSKRIAKGVTTKQYIASPNFTVANQNLDDLSKLLPTQIGFIIETDIFNKLRSTFKEIYFEKRREKEVDFVFEPNPKHPRLLEVKYRNRVRSNDLDFLKRRMHDYKTPYSFVITKDYLDLHEFKKEGKNYRIWLIPAMMTSLLKKPLSVEP